MVEVSPYWWASLAAEGADRITVSITVHQFFLLAPGLTGSYMTKPISRSVTTDTKTWVVRFETNPII